MQFLSTDSFCASFLQKRVASLPGEALPMHDLHGGSNKLGSQTEKYRRENTCLCKGNAYDL